MSQEGLEPPTNALRGHRSTIELLARFNRTIALLQLPIILTITFDGNFKSQYAGYTAMKGFFAPFLIIVLLCVLSFGIYFGLLNYQKFSGSRYAVESLDVVDSNFTFFNDYTPGKPTTIGPKVIFSNGTFTYLSPFSPCLTLIEDPNWQIYAGRGNLFQGYNSKIYYDRYWHAIWLALLPKDENPTALPVFYGPFLFEDVPKHGFTEYLLIGRDIMGSDGSINLTPADACATEESKLIQLTVPN